MGKSRAGTVDPEFGALGGEAIAEPPVDERLGGPEHGYWFSAFADVVELGTHHGREDALPSVSWANRDPGDASAGEPGAGDGHVERPDAGRTHDLVAVPDGAGAVELTVLEGVREEIGLEVVAEGGAVALKESRRFIETDRADGVVQGVPPSVVAGGGGRVREYSG